MEPAPIAAVTVLPPTGHGRHAPPMRWPGPGVPPRGLGMCRILITDTFDRRFGAPGRAVLVVGLPGDRRMRRLDAGDLKGRGWAERAATIAARAARILNAGGKP